MEKTQVTNTISHLTQTHTDTHRHRGNGIVGNHNSREMKIPDRLLKMPDGF